MKLTAMIANKEAWQVHLRMKAVLLVVFFSHWGIMHYEFPLEDKKVNRYFYQVVLRCLWNAVWRKWPEMWTVGSWLLHCDNAPVHTVLSIRQLLAKHSIPTLPQHPYSHDISPLNFLYSLNSKLPLKEDFKQWKTSSLMRRMTWRWY
jgi:hypothetical protein